MIGSCVEDERSRAVAARVLFVDDDPGVFEGISRSLRPFRGEFSLRGGGSVDEALGAMRSWSPEVVVSDVAMPGRSGLELLREVSRDPELRFVPVIILTGSAESDLKRRALDLGAVDLLNKPIGVEDLVARLRNAVRLRRYEDRVRGEARRLEGLVRRRTLELEHAHAETVLRLAMAGESRDRETGAHVCRVAYASAAIAAAIGYPESRLAMLTQAAALHDIGKIGVPDSVLLKPGPLDECERLLMQGHCRIGWELLRQDRPAGGGLVADALATLGPGSSGERPRNGVLELASVIVLSHHERWDGGGYPNGSRGIEIPLEARIVAVADVFEALCHKRPYKESMPVHRAAALIEQESGRHFDPTVVGGFRRALQEVLRVFARFSD
ncbi:MAG: HD domain-containing phosphohydrolase [Phycisphaerales bacterium JB040]